MANQLELSSTYRWVKVFDYQNDDNVEITRTERFEWKRTLISSEFRETAREEAMRSSASLGSSVQAGGSYEIISASVNHNIELSIEINSTMRHLSRNETQEKFEEKDSLTETFKVKPGGRIVAYRLEFLGPGISVTSRRIVTRPGPDPEYEQELDQVKIICELRQHRFLSNIKVHYGRWESQTPNNHIPVIWNKSADVGHDFSDSDFVWLIPEWTENASHEQTCTSVGYYRSAYKSTDAQDLASGAGGDYRYLQIGRNPNIPRKIVDIAMLRSNYRQSEEDAKKLGYEGMSSDFNEGREHDYVYLVWNAININYTVKK